MSEKKSIQITVSIKSKNNVKIVAGKSKHHPMNTFRKNEVSGHPAYVFYRHGNSYEYIGITHSDKNGAIPLNVNPNPTDERVAHIKPKPEALNANKLKTVLKGWKFDESDRHKVNKVKNKSVFKQQKKERDNS